MVEEKNKITKEQVEKIEEKVEDATKKEAKKAEEKTTKTEKVETKKKEIVKKEVAIANAYSLKISPKQSKYICRLLKHKTPEAAISRLQEVVDEKRAVPMAGLEVAHQKGKGLSGGKFPKTACKAIMEVVKQVKANATVAGIENPIITIAKADKASEPYRRQGQKGRRTHLHIEVKDKTKLAEKKKK